MRKTLFQVVSLLRRGVVNLLRREVVSLNRREVVNLSVFCTRHRKLDFYDLVIIYQLMEEQNYIRDQFSFLLI